MATYWENSCSFGLRYVSWYKYLIVSLVFSQLGFRSGNLFLIAPFPHLCLLVPFYYPTLPEIVSDFVTKLTIYRRATTFTLEILYVMLVIDVIGHGIAKTIPPRFPIRLALVTSLAWYSKNHGPAGDVIFFALHECRTSHAN